MKLEIKGLKAVLSDFSPEEKEKLEDTLTVSVPNAWYSEKYKSGLWDGKKRFYQRTAGQLRIHIGLINIILQLYPDIEVINRPKEELYEPIKIGYCIRDKVLREYQISAVNSVRNKRYGILNMATNSGKTITALACIREYLSHKPNRKSLVLTHSQEIARQVYDVLKNLLGDEFMIGMIGLGKDFKPEADITVAMVKTLQSRSKTEEYSVWLKSIGMCVIDECHHATASTFTSVLKLLTQAESLIGLTGTVPEDKLGKLSLYSVIGSTISVVRNSQMIEEGVSVKPECILTLVSDPKLYEKGNLTYQQAYSLGICLSKVRNNEIIQIVRDERKEDNQVLILCEHLEHSESLYSLLLEDDRKSSLGVIESIHGSTDDNTRAEALRQFSEAKINVLIATSILDEGVDVSNIDAIIYARGGKSMRKLLQSLGRGLRAKEGKTTVRLYDFIDNDNDYLADHSEERKKILKSEGFHVRVRNLDGKATYKAK